MTNVRKNKIINTLLINIISWEVDAGADAALGNCLGEGKVLMEEKPRV